MNILTTNGWVGRYVTDWAGPEALLRCVDIRLGAPNYPGDTMALTGTGRREAATASSTIAVRGANRLGDHVTRLGRSSRCREDALRERCSRTRPRSPGIGATEFSKDSGRSELRLAVEAVLGGARRRRARARGRRRHGDVHDGQQPRDRGEPLPRRRRPALLLAHPLRRRRRVRADPARGDGGRRPASATSWSATAR